MSTGEPERFGAQLRRYREAAGLSQEELAERARMSPRGVSDLERGARSRPRRETVRLLTEALGLSSAHAARFEAAARGREYSDAQVPITSRLPDPLTPLLGREREVARVSDIVADEHHRLVTLTGPGGVGKTRLAIEVARRVTHESEKRSIFVPLASISRPDLVLASAAELVQIDSRVDSLIDALAAAVGGRPALIVLDNFEHVLAAAADVAQLIERCPQLTVLITTRVPLRLRGEYQLEVLPLALPGPAAEISAAALTRSPAVALFVERMAAQRAGVELTDELALDVAEICRRLEGLPLALELAAARTRVLSARQLLQRLDSRLAVLTGGPVDLPARQQTMRATIDWSFGLLREDDRRLLTRLSVFRGGWTLDTAEAVCSGQSDIYVLDGMTALVDASLVLRTRTGENTFRFAMLETVREYAGERLEAAGETHGLSQRHAEHFARFVENARLGRRPMQPYWNDIDNIRQAREWLRRHDMRAALLMGLRLGRIWGMRFNRADYTGWLDDVRAWSHILPQVERAEVLQAAADSFLLESGEDPQRIHWYEESQALRRELGDQYASVGAVAIESWKALENGMPECAAQCFQRGLDLLRENGISVEAESAVKQLTLVAMRLGRFVQATMLARDGRGLAEARADEHDVAARVGELADIALLAGDLAAARTKYEQSLEIRLAIQDWNCSLHPLAGLGYVALEEGDAVRALEWFDQRSRLIQGAESMSHAAQSLNLLGHASFLRGDQERAATLFQEGLRLAREADDGVIQSECLLGLAGFSAATGEYEQAARLMGASTLFGATLIRPVSLLGQGTRERYVGLARAHMDRDRWHHLWEEGRRMTKERAVASALKNEVSPVANQ